MNLSCYSLHTFMSDHIEGLADYLSLCTVRCSNPVHRVLTAKGFDQDSNTKGLKKQGLLSNQSSDDQTNVSREYRDKSSSRCHDICSFGRIRFL
jgi:hypothetical protein